MQFNDIPFRTSISGPTASRNGNVIITLMSSVESGNSVSANRQIARAAGTVMLAFILSNLVGLVRGILIYRAFGTSAELDSFNAANRVTEVLFNLIAGGALGSAFIPTFTGFLTRGDKPGAWKLAASIANILIVVLTGISALAALFAPQVVRYGLFLLNPGGSPGQEALTVDLLRILLPSVVIFGLSGLVMGILNAHQKFLIPALAPVMYSLGMIIGVLFFPPAWGIFRLAWGALAGSGLHLLVQLPSLFRLKVQYWRGFNWGNPAVREVARLFLPRVFGVAVVQLNFIVNTILALNQPEGSVSSISLAFSLMLMPQMAIAQSIAIASLPAFSAQVASGRFAEMRASLAATLRGVLLLAVPAAAGLILLRQPLIRLLYEDGAVFTSRSTEMVAWALLWYALGLVGHSVVEIISRAFYALHDTRTPVLVGAAAMSLNVLFSLLFSRLFLQAGWMPHGGLALANALATTLEMAALLILMRRRLDGLDGKQVLDAFWKALLAALLMSAGLAAWLRWLPASSTAVVALGGVVLGTFIYGGMAAALRVTEFNRLLNALRRLAGKRLLSGN